MTDQFDPIKVIDKAFYLIKSGIRLETVLDTLCHVARDINLAIRGNPPDYEFRLRMKTGVYVGMAPDLRAAILMALRRAKEAMEGVRENVKR